MNRENMTALAGILLVVLYFLFSLIFGATMIQAFTGIDQETAMITPERMYASCIRSWVCLLLVWLYARKVEKTDMLFWKDSSYKLMNLLWHLILLLFTVFIAILLVVFWINVLGQFKMSPLVYEIRSLAQESTLLMLFIVVTAGVTEELIFRGYIQPRLQTLFHNPNVAIVITAVLFGLLHFSYGTLLHVVGIVAMGLVFSYYYWKYRNIKVLILCHAIYDFMVLNVKTGNVSF